MAAPSLVLRPEICGRLGRPPPVAGALRRPLLVGVRRRLTVLADSCPSRRGCASACPCGARPNPVRAFARGQPLGFPTYPLCSPASLSRVAPLVACSSPPFVRFARGLPPPRFPPRGGLYVCAARFWNPPPLSRAAFAPAGAGFAAGRMARDSLRCACSTAPSQIRRGARGSRTPPVKFFGLLCAARKIVWPKNFRGAPGRPGAPGHAGDGGGFPRSKPFLLLL